MQPTESGPAQPQSHPLPPPPAPQQAEGSSSGAAARPASPLPPPASCSVALLPDGRWEVTYHGRKAIARSGNLTFRKDGSLRLESDHGDKPGDALRYPTANEYEKQAQENPPSSPWRPNLGEQVVAQVDGLRGECGRVIEVRGDAFILRMNGGGTGIWWLHELAPLPPLADAPTPASLHPVRKGETLEGAAKRIAAEHPCPSPSDAGEFIENGRHKRGERLCRGIGVQFPKGKGSRALERYAAVVPAQGTRAEFVKAYRLLADALERGEGAVMGENRLVESEVNAADYPGEYVDSMTLEVEEQAKMEAAKASRPAPVIEPEPPDGEDFQPARDANGAPWSPRSGDEVELRTTGERGVVVSFCPACYWTVKWSNGASSMVSALSLRPAGKMPATPKLRPAFDHLGRPLFRFGDTVVFKDNGQTFSGIVTGHMDNPDQERRYNICTEPPSETPRYRVTASAILGIPA